MNNTVPLLLRRRTALSLGIALGFASVPHAGSAAPGDPLGLAVRVDTPAASGWADSPSVASDAAGNFAVAWRDYGKAGGLTSPAAIQLRLFGADGTAQGDAQTVNAPSASYGEIDSPVVVMDQDGDAVVAWSGPGSKTYHGVYARRYDASGQPKDDGFEVDDAPRNSQVSPPAVAMDADGNFVLAWAQSSVLRLIPFAYYSPMLVSSSVHARRYSADGTAARKDQTLKVLGGLYPFAPAIRDYQAPAVAIDAQSNVAVAWLEERYFSGGIEAVRLSANGIQQGFKFSPSTVFGPFPGTPSAGMSADGQLTLAWTAPNDAYTNSGLYAQRWPARGPSSGAFTVQPGVGSDFVQDFPGVAVNAAGQSVVAWMQYPNGGSTNTVLAQMYAANGSPVGNPVVISDQGSGGFSRLVSVALAADGSFVVAWVSGSGIWAQRFEGGY
jgi:hypothetical protein